MNDEYIAEYSKHLEQIIQGTNDLNFDMASEPKTRGFLRILSSSKPKGKFLELGTETGLTAAWILEGMDQYSSLISIDNDPETLDIAIDHLGTDNRVGIVKQCN